MGDTERAEKFYEDLADYSKSRQICKLALLGKVADKSNGTINGTNKEFIELKYK